MRRSAIRFSSSQPATRSSSSPSTPRAGTHCRRRRSPANRSPRRCVHDGSFGEILRADDHPAGSRPPRLSGFRGLPFRGNAPESAAIEFMNLGGSFTCEGGDLHIALGGAGIAMNIDGTPVPPQTSAILKEGQVLDVGHPRTGTFAYLAIAGGFAVEPELGSLSFHLRSRLGGLDGAALRAGDRLPCRASGDEREPTQLAVQPPEEEGAVRVMMGPQADY